MVPVVGEWALWDGLGWKCSGVVFCAGELPFIGSGPGAKACNAIEAVVRVNSDGRGRTEEFAVVAYNDLGVVTFVVGEGMDDGADGAIGVEGEDDTSEPGIGDGSFFGARVAAGAKETLDFLLWDLKRRAHGIVQLVEELELGPTQGDKLLEWGGGTGGKWDDA
jgi:hypothetical protein